MAKIPSDFTTNIEGISIPITICLEGYQPGDDSTGSNPIVEYSAHIDIGTESAPMEIDLDTIELDDDIKDRLDTEAYEQYFER